MDYASNARLLSACSRNISTSVRAVDYSGSARNYLRRPIDITRDLFLHVHVALHRGRSHGFRWRTLFFVNEACAFWS